VFVAMTAWLLSSTPVLAASRGVVFVNFDGAELLFGNDDARDDTTVLSELAGPFPAYGGTSQRDATLQAVRSDFAAYDVLVVDTRPSSGNYTMAMVGPYDAGTTLGIAPLDCRDSFPNNIVFAFHGDGDGYTSTAQANTISQEVAHSFGLEHVADQRDIMYPVSTGGDPGFLDECVKIVPSPDIVCGSQHEEHCPSGEQSSHRELLARFGPAVPIDPAETVVEIVAPDDGEELDVAEPFDIVAASVDGRPFANVVLFVDESNIGGRTQAPYTWRVEGLTEGIYTAYVIAIDDGGIMSRSESIEIFVGVENPDDDDEGGGCRVGDAQRVPAWSLVTFGLLWLRRRRR
jgi:MYXO-CTERM domain-containing protein